MVRSVYKQSTLGLGQDPGCFCNSVRNWQKTTNREKIIAVKISFMEEPGILHLLSEQLRGGKQLQGRSHRDLNEVLVPKYRDGFGSSAPFLIPFLEAELGEQISSREQSGCLVSPTPLTAQQGPGSLPSTEHHRSRDSALPSAHLSTQTREKNSTVLLFHFYTLVTFSCLKHHRDSPECQASSPLALGCLFLTKLSS